jgi:hypothetical protein
MSAVPLTGYEVEFIPLERRLDDRRFAPSDTPLPPGIKMDRRRSQGRRADDQHLPQSQLRAVQ